jgi:hypothetical protein
MSQHSRSGRHRPGGSGAVFVDASGRRVRLARRAVHLGIGVCVLLLAALTFSLFGNVPLPGLRPPVTLPGNTHASKHTPALARESTGGTSTRPTQATLPGVSSGSASASRAAPSSSVSAARPTSRSHGRPSTTPSVAPTPSSTSSSRSHGPPITPPGKTKPPHT